MKYVIQKTGGPFDGYYVCLYEDHPGLIKLLHEAEAFDTIKDAKEFGTRLMAKTIIQVSEQELFKARLSDT